MSDSEAGQRSNLPDVSVIVPAFNCERIIAECLDSILASEYPQDRFEVLCIDNASTDGTARVVDRYRESVTVLREEKRGASAARNAGLRAASGEIVAFTDADCTVDRHWLRNLIEPVRIGSASAAGGKILARPGANAIELFGELLHNHERAIRHSRPPYLISMNMAAPLDLLRSLDGFDERWLRAQDVDLSLRMLKAGVRFAYAEDAVIFHRNRSTLRELARLGYLHGVYRPALFQVHRDVVEEYRRSRDTAPPFAESAPAAEQLNPWRIRLYRAIFETGRKSGELRGRSIRRTFE